MGKKSLIKSTSKKKRAPKKGAATAKPKKKAQAKKAIAKSKPAKTAAPKKGAARTEPVSVRDLLKKKFDVVAPAELYRVPEELVGKSTFTAPEMLASFAPADGKRIRGLLANRYSEADLKAAAEKAAAEKAAAEKAAAEKAAAEKAAAEKAAAEKAAAEKAAAEKAAAEKAAAEKAAAEKAAAEKAAAEKAAAEKAAAEKAAEIKQAAAQKSDVAVSYDPPPAQATATTPSDPVDNTIKIAIAGLAFLILLVIGASTSNSFKYYLTENQGALEIWKGKFAPLGKKMVVALPGLTAPENIKDTYSSSDVYPIAFQYLIDKADALLDVPGIPDFEGIKAALKSALEYGSTDELRKIAYQRLDNIDLLVLTYKAEVAASRGTIDDLKSAISLYGEVDKLTTEATRKSMIAETIATHEATIVALEEAAAAEAAEAEAQAAAVEAEANQGTSAEVISDEAVEEQEVATDGEAPAAAPAQEEENEAEAEASAVPDEAPHAEGEQHDS